MNVGLLGGTFDPIHRGHLAVARAAQQRFDLGRILFVPAGAPPHKQEQPLTPYAHRYAMVALATSDQRAFVPSDIESYEQLGGKPSYSIDTVRRLKKQLKKSDRLFFIIGMDAFREIATWRAPEELLRETDFIVVSRPGYSLADIGASLPESLSPDAKVTKALRSQPASGDIVLKGAALHVLPDVHEEISATQIRAAARTGRKLDALVGEPVAEYIRKTGLYKAPLHKNRPQTTAHNKQTSQSNVRDREKE
jgi:nicotinate-nucleotide adenylyltransferase